MTQNKFTAMLGAMASEKLTKTQILLALAVGLLLAIAFIALVPADPAPLIYEQF